MSLQIPDTMIYPNPVDIPDLTRSKFKPFPKAVEPEQFFLEYEIDYDSKSVRMIETRTNNHFTISLGYV